MSIYLFICHSIVYDYYLLFKEIIMSENAFVVLFYFIDVASVCHFVRYWSHFFRILCKPMLNDFFQFLRWSAVFRLIAWTYGIEFDINLCRTAVLVRTAAIAWTQPANSHSSAIEETYYTLVILKTFKKKTIITVK